jgi:importin subunit beta-1
MAGAEAEPLAAVLQKAQVADAATRQDAEQALEARERDNLAGHARDLAIELEAEDRPIAVRALAGLLLKNALDAKTESLRAEREDRWLSLPTDIRNAVKSSLLSSLHSHEAQARHTAAQAIGKIARAELHRGDWPDLVPSLMNNMSASSSGLRQATMQALGYVCEETAQQQFEQSFVDRVLTAVVSGMRATLPSSSSSSSSSSEQQQHQQHSSSSSASEKQQHHQQHDVEVRLAATEAMHNALAFVEENFKRDNERNYIMQVVCEGTCSPDTRIRQASYECLVAIATEYYPYLAPYMSTIYDLSAWRIRNDDESVALQAIEFWSSIAEEEAEREEARDEGDDKVLLYGFLRSALQQLVPLLLETLTKQADPEDEDPDLWNTAMAGGTCLGLVSAVAKDDVVPLVMPFVNANVSKESWREREAATYAYGSIMEGPDPSNLVATASEAVPYMLSLLKDSNASVRDTAAWTLGRIFECVHGREGENQVKLLSESNIAYVVQNLEESLQSNDSARVTEKVCYAMQKLIAGFEERQGDRMSARASMLTQFFQRIAFVLLRVSERRDAATTKVRSTAYEALNELVRVSSRDTDNFVLQLVHKMIEQLDAVTQHDESKLNDEQRSQLFEMQGSVCGSLQVMIQKLSQSQSASQSGLLNYCDTIMAQLLRVLSYKNSTVHEEAFLAIGSVASMMGQAFDRYMDNLFPFVEQGLRNYEHYAVCQVTVGLVGDLSRALEGKIERFCGSIVPILLNNLQSSELNMKVKPPIISTLGDLALAVGPSFQQYISNVMAVLFEAAKTSIQMARQASQAREDTLETNYELRKSIFEAFSGIFMGLKEHREALDTLKQYDEHTALFLEEVAKDIDDSDAETLTGALGLLGDLAEALPSSARHLQRPGVAELARKGSQHHDPTVAQPANRAHTCAPIFFLMFMRQGECANSSRVVYIQVVAQGYCKRITTARAATSSCMI